MSDGFLSCLIAYAKACDGIHAAGGTYALFLDEFPAALIHAISSRVAGFKLHLI